MNLDKIEIFYIEHHKKLLLIPLILLVISLGLIGLHFSKNGSIHYKDVSIKGGISATIDTQVEIDIKQLEDSFPKEAIVRRLTDPLSQEQVGINIQVSEMDEKELTSFLEKKLEIKLNSDNFSIQETGPSLGETFYSDLIKALIFAFVLMGIVIFISFRKFVPSFAVILAAFSDIVITLAIINLFKIQLSTAGIVAFLFLIGYSVDSDILLTTKTLKTKIGTPFQRMINASKTGLTMSGTTIAVLVVALIFTTNPTLQQMFMILIIGLFIDILTTYLTNTGLLYWYVTRK